MLDCEKSCSSPLESLGPGSNDSKVCSCFFEATSAPCSIEPGGLWSPNGAGKKDLSTKDLDPSCELAMMGFLPKEGGRKAEGFIRKPDARGVCIAFVSFVNSPETDPGKDALVHFI